MRLTTMRRMAWAAVFELGFFKPRDEQDQSALARGEKLRRGKTRRGNLYRAVAKYIAGRMEQDEVGDYYVPASLSHLFWSGPFAGNYSWPILHRPAEAAAFAVYNRRDYTRRGQGNEASFPDDVKSLQFRDKIAVQKRSR